MPLAALRGTLDETSAGSSWLLHPDGVLGRVLLVPAGNAFTIPLRLSGEAFFSGQVMLLPHDWRDGRGTVRATLAVTEADGNERELWSDTVRAAADFGRPRGRRVTCPLPAGTTSLRLSVDVVGVLRDRSVARAVWLEPVIIDRARPASLDRRPGAGTGRRRRAALARR